ncbi:hypothetical protein MtrunA17_Chr7g0275221 [Medicago truncatula]|uniref:Uncharacterized protein n=1 Tax=Medicago truncatula TaxID=3880 RepID=A0A396HA08_MEDTR|nr:hypothetical protein MtrunA17_Chr7g0275221 [Medicago truncatula]
MATIWACTVGFWFILVDFIMGDNRVNPFPDEHLPSLNLNL